MSAPFSRIPSTARVTPSAFTASIPQEQLSDLRTLVKLSKIAPPTYENSQSDYRFGITSDWLVAIREKWINDFDWYLFRLFLDRLHLYYFRREPDSK
jgi:microsomal epoxide hydrolase